MHRDRALDLPARLHENPWAEAYLRATFFGQEFYPSGPVQERLRVVYWYEYEYEYSYSYRYVADSKRRDAGTRTTLKCSASTHDIASRTALSKSSTTLPLKLP